MLQMFDALPKFYHTGDVGIANINKFARFKPVRYPSVGLITNANRQSVAHGIVIPDVVRSTSLSGAAIQDAAVPPLGESMSDYEISLEIAKRFGRADAPALCGESWEVSAHPDGMSVVEGGPFDGRDLASLCEEFGAALVGSFAEGTRRASRSS